MFRLQFIGLVMLHISVSGRKEGRVLESTSQPDSEVLLRAGHRDAKPRHMPHLLMFRSLTP